MADKVFFNFFDNKEPQIGIFTGSTTKIEINYPPSPGLARFCESRVSSKDLSNERWPVDYSFIFIIISPTCLNSIEFLL